MNTNDINMNEHILRPLIDKAILDSVSWIMGRCKPQEPDFIAALSVNFTQDLFNILRAVFPKYSFSITGVYCHQKPIVDIGMSKKPELGDLLFVYADKNNYGQTILNSLLLQAKISSSPNLTIHSNEQHQLELYRKWPEFTYSRAGILNGEKRNILPKTINDGAQYLLIDNNPLTNGICGVRGTYPMGCAIPSNVLCINDNLSREIINFLKFKSGRVFEDNKCSTMDDWSKMIWDLLSIANLKFSRRKNARLGRIQRKNEHVCFYTEDMMGKSLFDKLGVDNKFLDRDFNANDDAGVSVILIESNLVNELE